LVFLLLAFLSVPLAMAAPLRTLRPVRVLGSGTMRDQARPAADTATPVETTLSGQSNQIRNELDLHKPTIAAAGGNVAGMAPVRPLPLAGVSASFFGFDGISHSESRMAENGNQFNSEPPDMALAASGAQIVQVVNHAVAVYSPLGERVAGPASLNGFFGLAAAIARDPQVRYGPMVSDPRVVYDSELQRWFLSALEVETDSASGAPLRRSHVLLAVSAGPDATGAFLRYSVDVTDAGFADCPCLGDQPLIGLNHDGIFVSTNQFSFRTSKFQTALVLALDKRALARGTVLNAVSFQRLSAGGGPAFSLQPALNAPGYSGIRANNGTQFLLSSIDMGGMSGSQDDRLALWAIYNTASLRSASPAPMLHQTLVRVNAYREPPAAAQRDGVAPLRQALNAHGWSEPLEQLESGDDRMQQVYLANGKLYAALATAVTDSTGDSRAGIAWFVLAPATGPALGARVAAQGYVAAENADLLYPSMALNAQGAGVLAFTLAGEQHFPSAAYVSFADDAAGEAIHLAREGAGPEDGFSGYEAFGGEEGTARWGDYSAATVAPDGTLWFGVEYITARPRSLLANWGTFIGRAE
jgi:hypothetical protein